MIWFLLACGQFESETLKPSEMYTTQNVQIMSSSVTGGLGWNYPQTSILPLEFQNEDETIQQARDLFADSKDMEVVKLLVPYVSQNPDNFVAHSLISAAFFRLRDFEQAARAAQKVVELRPSGLTYANYAITLQFLGYPEKALLEYERALEYDRKNFLVVRNMASLNYVLKDLPQAQHYLEEMIRSDPNDSYAYVALGQVLVEQGKYAEAEYVYRFRLQEVSIMSEQSQREAGGLLLDLPLALGRVCLLQGNRSAAYEWLNKTVEYSETKEGTWTSEQTYALEAKRTLAGMALEEGKLDEAARLVTEGLSAVGKLLKDRVIPNSDGMILRQNLLEIQSQIRDRQAE